MMMSLRTVRNLTFGVLLAVTVIGMQKQAFASSCVDVYGSQYINFVYGGPFDYENQALDYMDGVARGICWGHAYYYWHVRVGPLDGPGYYDGMWTCG